MRGIRGLRSRGLMSRVGGMVVEELMAGDRRDG